MTDRISEALRLVSALSSAGSPEKAVELFEKAVEPFGVRIYAGAAVINPLRATENLIIDNWSEEWTEFYHGTRAFIYDPVFAGMTKRESFYWRDLKANGPKGAKLMKDAGEIGMKDGFTAVHERPGQFDVSVSVSGDKLEWTDLERGVVSFVASSFMARVLYLRDVTRMEKVQTLSPREAGLLLQAAIGRSDKEIAQELELSPNTVWSYWKNIRRKLNVHDRASAVAMATLTRQITP